MISKRILIQMVQAGRDFAASREIDSIIGLGAEVPWTAPKDYFS